MYLQLSRSELETTVLPSGYLQPLFTKYFPTFEGFDFRECLFKLTDKKTDISPTMTVFPSNRSVKVSKGDFTALVLALNETIVNHLRRYFLVDEFIPTKRTQFFSSTYTYEPKKLQKQTHKSSATVTTFSKNIPFESKK